MCKILLCAHKTLSPKLSVLFSQFTQLKNITNNWRHQINDINANCIAREEKRKVYEHYEEKLYELNTERMIDIKK